MQEERLKGCQVIPVDDKAWWKMHHHRRKKNRRDESKVKKTQIAMIGIQASAFTSRCPKLWLHCLLW